jgi:DNA-binding transcriptional MocR family regulator
VSHVLQATVAWLLRDAATALRRAKASAIYASRRTALLDALTERGIAASGVSGFNVWIPTQRESHTVQQLLEAGWAVYPGEYCRISSPPGIRVTTAVLTEADSGSLADAVAGAAVRSRSQAPFA